jgi:hypothetical protein
MLCGATSADHENSYANALEHAPWTRCTRDHVDYLSLMASDGTVNPMITVPGWHCFNQYEDPLHDDLIGLRQDVNGSSIVQLAEEGAWSPMVRGGIWKKRYNTVLSKATQCFKSYLKTKRIRCSQPRFTVANLSTLLESFLYNRAA